MRAKVLRPARDDFSWSISDDNLIGEVSGVVVGAPSVSELARFPHMVSTEGLLGIPWEQDGGIVVQQHDRLVTEDNQKYAVVSDRLWTGENVLTGTVPSYYWVEVRASS